MLHVGPERPEPVGAVARPFRPADPFGSPRSQTLFTMSKTPARALPGPPSFRRKTTNLVNDLCRELREARLAFLVKSGTLKLAIFLKHLRSNWWRRTGSNR